MGRRGLGRHVRVVQARIRVLRSLRPGQRLTRPTAQGASSRSRRGVNSFGFPPLGPPYAVNSAVRSRASRTGRRASGRFGDWGSAGPPGGRAEGGRRPARTGCQPRNSRARQVRDAQVLARPELRRLLDGVGQPRADVDREALTFGCRGGTFGTNHEWDDRSPIR